jgi:hypothetical protein
MTSTRKAILYPRTQDLVKLPKWGSWPLLGGECKAVLQNPIFILRVTESKERRREKQNYDYLVYSRVWEGPFIPKPCYPPRIAVTFALTPFNLLMFERVLVSWRIISGTTVRKYLSKISPSPPCLLLLFKDVRQDKFYFFRIAGNKLSTYQPQSKVEPSKLIQVSSYVENIYFVIRYRECCITLRYGCIIWCCLTIYVRLWSTSTEFSKGVSEEVWHELDRADRHTEQKTGIKIERTEGNYIRKELIK